MSQTDLAKLRHSSRSRVAKMEGGGPSVSIDLRISSLLALGASSRDLARTMARASPPNALVFLGDSVSRTGNGLTTTQLPSMSRNRGSAVLRRLLTDYVGRLKPVRLRASIRRFAWRWPSREQRNT